MTPPYKDQRPVIIGKSGYFGEHAEILRLVKYYMEKRK